jgi:hypothetical protein
MKIRLDEPEESADQPLKLSHVSTTHLHVELLE